MRYVRGSTDDHHPGGHTAVMANSGGRSRYNSFFVWLIVHVRDSLMNPVDCCARTNSNLALARTWPLPWRGRAAISDQGAPAPHGRLKAAEQLKVVDVVA